MDNLEKFIASNRAEFDSEMPTGKIWRGVEAHLNKNDNLLLSHKSLPKSSKLKAKGIKLFMRIAAAVALLIVGTFIGICIQKKLDVRASDESGTPLASDLKEAEKFYDTRIKSDMIRLAAFKADSTIYFDLRQIDAVQEELRHELQQAPLSSQTEIIQRMIQNYQIKADILEKVLQHVEKNSNQFINKDSIQNESI